MTRTVVIRPDIFHSKDTYRHPERGLQEAVALAKSIDLLVVDAKIIKIRRLTPSTLFGTGIIRSLAESLDNQKIELEKFDGSNFIILPTDYHNDNSTKICFLDLETTGLNTQDCKIIEFAAKLTAIDNTSGELLGVVDEYQSFNDPEEIIDPVITKITGIDNSTVQGHSIDWEDVSRLLNNADIVVAHNAQFDRGVMDRFLLLSQDKVWLCSMKDINWMERGLNKRSQEILCIWHGFYYDSHRAMFDVDALIHLVTYNVEGATNAVLELLTNATKPTYLSLIHI